jgi:hypothetical protein
MGNDKSILEKFTDTVKGIAETATNAASQALKAEQPPVKEEDLAALSMPLAGDGFVSDPMLVPPAAAAPRPRKRAAPKRSAGKVRKTAKTAGKKAAKQSARKVTKKSAVRKSSKAAKKTTRRPTRTRTRKTAR